MTEIHDGQTRGASRSLLPPLLDAFRSYYSVTETNVEPPFLAEAEFRMHDEQFFLIRSARITEYDSREYVYFAAADDLTPERYRALEEAAWTRGIQKVSPDEGHRNTDITLVILTEDLPEDTARAVRKAWRHKSYRFGLRGWSSLRVIVHDCRNHVSACNRLGGHLKEVVAHIDSM